jgi:hypothetical protein
MPCSPSCADSSVILWVTQDLLSSTGRKHAALIARWWLAGSLLGWLLGLTVSVVTSPILGFIVVIPFVGIFLLFGYGSSSVEMKVSKGLPHPAPGGEVVVVNPRAFLSTRWTRRCFGG